MPILATAKQGGFASVSLPIPYDIALRGATAYAQGIVLDPMGAASGLALSAGRRLVLGDSKRDLHLLHYSGSPSSPSKNLDSDQAPAALVRREGAWQSVDIESSSSRT